MLGDADALDALFGSKSNARGVLSQRLCHRYRYRTDPSGEERK